MATTRTPSASATGASSACFSASTPAWRTGKSYADLVSSLLYGGDQYMLLADFDSYVACHDRLYATAANKSEFARMSLVNIAESGIFAADRAIREYAEKIWHIEV